MKKILLFLYFIPFIGISQTFSSENFGATAGLVFNIGTHSNRIGLALNSYYHDLFYQINLGTTLTFNINGYGKRKNFLEARNSLGLILLAGKKEAHQDFQLDGLLNNTTYNYGLGYNYLWYFDNAGTSQRSGGWAAHIKNFSILFENDLFGGQGKDRFRSGHLAVSYKYDQIKFTSGLFFWTGESALSFWDKTPMENCPSGFRSLEDLPYGNTSHGILYGGVNYNIGYGQFATLKVGVDSENIRHYFQNRLIHDLILLPKSVKRNTPHYPRLNEEGCPVFDKNDVRKDRLFLQFGSNDSWAN